MKIIESQSQSGLAEISGHRLAVTNYQFQPFSQGTNKADEYSWFYLLCLQGKPGEIINVEANIEPSTSFTRTNSLVYWSLDRWQWHKLDAPVHTDHTGLPQKYSFTLLTSQPVYLSNTMLYEFDHLCNHLRRFVEDHPSICYQSSIGQSLNSNDLSIITFPAQQQELGRILVTTGCHPAEPDVTGSLAILDYLASPAAHHLLANYTVDVMPMQNPDGYQLKSCLTANGINLYWNFRHHDKISCPEAYYLWQHIRNHPPLLYLDFHAYVHQYHRHPMPYLQSLACYTGSTTKKLVKKMDKTVVDLSQGFYRIGNLSMWPDALSTLVTKQYNTIAYTKYHFNMFEGETKSRQRAVDIFSHLTNLLIKYRIKSSHILKSPHGQVQPDNSDSPLSQKYYYFISRLKQGIIYFKSYYRYYRYRNRPALFP